MVEIMGVSQAAQRRAEPLSWLQRVFRALDFARRREDRPRRLDERTWSAYMLRDVGLDEGGLSRRRDPRDLPFDWPLR